MQLTKGVQHVDGTSALSSLRTPVFSGYRGVGMPLCMWSGFAHHRQVGVPSPDRSTEAGAK